MAETSDEIRRELEGTRERVGSTIAALERKVNPRHVLDDHPLVLLGVAFGTGVLLATTGAAKQAAKDVRSQIRHSAHDVNTNAGSALDRILKAVTQTATTAVTAKLTELVDSSMRGTKSSSATNIKSRAA